jgi:hypothetical protein
MAVPNAALCGDTVTGAAAAPSGARVAKGVRASVAMLWTACPRVARAPWWSCLRRSSAACCARLYERCRKRVGANRHLIQRVNARFETVAVNREQLKVCGTDVVHAEGENLRHCMS